MSASPDGIYGPLVGVCEVCGQESVLTLGLCGPCVVVVAPDASSLPQPPVSEPMPEPDEWMAGFSSRLFAREAILQARAKAQEGL